MDTLELRFRPSGPGRWLEAAFLSLWLLGWAAGELAVAAVLLAGSRTWLQGHSLPGLPSAPLALLVPALFLSLWLGFWTLGGLLALRQWLRCFWAEDRLCLSATDLDCHHRLGPWQRRRSLPRDAIRSVQLARHQSGRSGALIVQLDDRQLELTRLGSPQQRREAAQRFSQILGEATSQPPDAAAAVLPREWECEQLSFDCSVLVPARRQRRRQCLVLALLALPLDAGWLLLLEQVRSRLELLPALLMLSLFAGAASWGTLWLALGRREWRLERGELVAQRRFAGRVTTLFAARALELREASDEDGDLWYSLQATQLRPLGRGGRRDGGAELLNRSLHDPSEPRALGRWLAQRTGIAFDDQVPSEAQRDDQRQADLIRLRNQLRRRGRIGRWLAGWIGDLG